jgi:hypothetical protein
MMMMLMMMMMTMVMLVVVVMMMMISITYLGPKIASNKNLVQPEFILVAIYA